MKTADLPGDKTTRRRFLRTCAASTAALATTPLLGCRSTAVRPKPGTPGPAGRILSLDRDWLFGGPFNAAALAPAFDDAGFASVTLPHCVAHLSWQKWSPAAWEDVWIYRRHFVLPPDCARLRVFLEFDAVMVGAAPVVNGHALPQHLGGYLPFRNEITRWLNGRDNVLAVTVDSRWKSVPPEGSPRGPRSIDYLEPGGIVRSARLRAVPQVFLSDVFAKPVAVLGPDRRVEVRCTIDSAVVPRRPVRIEAVLKDGARVLARAADEVLLEETGEMDRNLTLSKPGPVTLWDPDTPQLYEVVVTLYLDGQPVHEYRRRIGFREARFERDGFYLNGRRFKLFGLNRHELFPYVGGAMPARVMRRDAEILRRDFHCNMVRCSHYPQSEPFLDACDELGLMVWEEPPGWQYLGDAAWQDLAVRDVRDMVRRDRNHPAIIVWGVRVNESANRPALYRRTKAAAEALDDSRLTSGTMTRHSTADWIQDVFAFDDYHSAPDGSVGLRSPLPGVPYLVSEAVGQFAYGVRKGGFSRKYRRAGDLAIQRVQALLHAQVHNKGGADPRYAGVIAWCAFDYGSLINSYEGVKCPGVADIFRIPKLGAAFYLTQGDPEVRPMIEPDFYWDFGLQSPAGPGPHSAIFSNCDRLELFLNGKPHAVLHPDRAGFPHLKHPPFFADLTPHGANPPDLRIDGFLGGTRVLSRSFSADPKQDQLWLRADDAELVADGSDATRVMFGVVDKFGAPRAFADGAVVLDLNGPGVIVGDNPFDLGPAGGSGAVWVRTWEDRVGRIEVRAAHRLGAKSVGIDVNPAPG
jgi:beta-galactosidase